jgi:Ca2+-binding EF-hand superfamily protein
MTESIPQELLLEYAEAFSVFDVKDNNTIPVSQVNNVLRTLGIVVPEALLLAIQSKKESEGEDVITFEEFLYLCGPAGRTVSQFEEDTAKERAAKLKRAIAVFDVSGTGVIAANDVKRALRDVLKESDVNSIIRSVDPQQTGKIDVLTLSEFLVGF